MQVERGSRFGDPKLFVKRLDRLLDNAVERDERHLRGRILEQHTKRLEGAHVSLDSDARQREAETLTQRSRLRADEIEARSNAFELLRHVPKRERHGNAGGKREGARRLDRTPPRFELVNVMGVVSHAISRRQALSKYARSVNRGGGIEIVVEKRFRRSRPRIHRFGHGGVILPHRVFQYEMKRYFFAAIEKKFRGMLP